MLMYMCHFILSHPLSLHNFPGFKISCFGISHLQISRLSVKIIHLGLFKMVFKLLKFQNNILWHYFMFKTFPINKFHSCWDVRIIEKLGEHQTNWLFSNVQYIWYKKLTTVNVISHHPMNPRQSLWLNEKFVDYSIPKNSYFIIHITSF